MSNGATIDFMMLGRWWHVGLDSEVVIARSAKRLAESSAGKHDGFTQVRAGIRDDITRAARIARAAGATDFYFAQEIVPDVAIPATLAVYWTDLVRDPLATSVAQETAAVAASLHGEERTVTTPDLIAGWGVVRAVGSLARGVDVPGATGEVVGASYWLLPQGSPHVVLMDFASPVPAVAHALYEVFDVMVSSASIRTDRVGDAV